MKNHLFLFFFLLPLIGTAQPVEHFSSLKDSIEAIMMEQAAAGAQIAIFTQDSIVWQENFGMANIADAIPVSKETFFRIGSVTKMFVAIAALQLIEQGALNLNDYLKDLAPDVVFKNKWEATHPIQIKHLLEHTTGFDDMHLAEYAANANGWTLKQGIDFHSDNRYARWRPGLHTSYCNSGPPIVAHIIEKITGQDFEEYVAENIFQPLGMTQSNFINTPEIATVLAKGYNEAGEVMPYWEISQRPAGSINSTMLEMIPFVQMLIGRGRLDSVQLLEPSSIERMETSRTTLAGKAGLKDGYGLHNYTTNYKGINWHGHDGGMLGYLAKVQYSSDLDIGFITLINSTGIAFEKINQQLNEAIYQQLQGRLIEPPVQATFDEQYLGYYRSATSRNQMLRFLDHIAGIVQIGKDETGYFSKSALSFEKERATIRSINTLTVQEETGFQSPLYFGEQDEEIYAQQVNNLLNLKKVTPMDAFTPLAMAALFLLFLLFLFGYALFWMVLKMLRKPAAGQWSLRLLPLIIVSSLLGLVFSAILGNEGNVLANLGTRTVYSMGIFVSSLLFGLSLLLFCWQSIRIEEGTERRWFRAFCMLASLVFIISTLFLFKEGLIGLRTWAY